MNLFKSDWSTSTAKGEKVVEIDIEGIIGFDPWDEDEHIIHTKEKMKSELKAISEIKATDIIVNIDWQINEAGGDEIAWRIVYSATPHNNTEAIGGAGTTVNSGDIVVPATVRYLTQTSLTIPSADLAVEDQVGITISRVAISDGTDPSTAEPGITDIHIEYIANKLGEGI